MRRQSSSLMPAVRQAMSVTMQLSAARPIDAPGMMRIKIPYGKLSATQLETLAAISEEYSDQILHVTTRQDIQLHFVHIEDTPDLMRRLALVGITTREACDNSVRNVTACSLSGVCQTESFDVTPTRTRSHTSCSATTIRRASAGSSRWPSRAARTTPAA